MHHVGVGRARVTLDVEQEVGRYKDRLQSELDALLRRLPMLLCERDELQQRAHLGPGDRTPVSAPGQVGDDLVQTGSASIRVADQDLRATDGRLFRLERTDEQ